MSAPLDHMAERLVRLEGWSVGTYPDDGYTAPELCYSVLRGTVTGHPRKPDGSKVRTNKIVSATGRVVTTKTGTCYLLGEPDPDYVAYLREQGRALDPREPVKVTR